MADFYTVLSRAVAQLPTNSPEIRQAVYDRARDALVAQLRRSDPPVAESEITRARLRLDDAINRLEMDLAIHESEAAPAVAEPAPLPEPVVEAPPAPVAPVATPEPASSVVVSAPAATETLDRVDDKPIDPPPVLRPRVPGRPRSRRFSAGHVRTAVVAGGVALAVMVVAGIGFYVNSGDPQPVPSRTASQDRAAQPQPSSGDAGKISERVGSEPTAPVQRPATASPSAGATPRPAIPVAQRAILYVENATNPQQPVVGQGRVSWRLDSEAAGPGQPADTLIRADADFPEQGLRLTLTVRRNLDASFPASHVLGLRFSRVSDDGNGAVKEAGVPQFKTDENERGAPLSAITSTLGDNLFVTALSNVKVERDRNVELLTKRTWVDIPVRFASGRRGIIAIEKGFSGDQTINDAFNRWRG